MAQGRHKVLYIFKKAPCPFRFSEDFIFQSRNAHIYNMSSVNLYEGRPKIFFTLQKSKQCAHVNCPRIYIFITLVLPCVCGRCAI